MADMDLQIKISSQVGDTVKSVDQLGKSFSQLSKAIGIAAASLQVFDKAGAAISNFGRQLDQASKGFKKFGRDLTQNVTLPLVALAGLSLKKVFDEAVFGRGSAVTNSFAQSVQSLKREFDALLITIGTQLAPIAERVVSFIRNLIAAFQALSPETRQMIINFGIIAAAIGPLSLAFSAITGIIAKLVLGIGQLVAFAPRLAALFLNPYTAIAALALGLVGVINLFANLKKAGVSTGESLFMTFKLLSDYINKTFWSAVSRAIKAVQNLAVEGEKLMNPNFTAPTGGALNDTANYLDKQVEIFNASFNKIKEDADAILAPIGSSVASSLTLGLSDVVAEAKSLFTSLTTAPPSAPLETKLDEEDAERVKRLQERQKAAVDRIKKDLEEVDAKAREIGMGIAGGLADAFVSVADGSKSAADAFNDFARSTINNLTKMILQAQLFNIIMGTFGGAINATAGSATPNNGGGQTPLPKATGGFVSGPGTGTSDSIPARLSNGEYVIRAKAVKSLGVGFLNGLNSMRHGAQPKTKGGVRAFADGGFVGTGGSTPQVVIQNSGTPKEATSTSFDPSSQVTTVILEDIQRNGSISKALQNGFGVKRGGFR